MPKNTLAVEPDDKMREQIRYDIRALARLDKKSVNSLGDSCGSVAISEVLRSPYQSYEKQVILLAKKGNTVLDICCGTGIFSLVSQPSGTRISVVDIAPNNVKLAMLTAKQRGFNILGKVGDAEALPFEDSLFDLVTCAGSLSYFDREKGLMEVARVLKPGGYFICVDSLNHNPFYRMNRWLHYLRGHRTLSTLKRMPKIEIFSEFEKYLGTVTYRSFHGIFTFLVPFLDVVLRPQFTADTINWLDKKFSFLEKYAFKFVAVVRKAS